MPIPLNFLFPSYSDDDLNEVAVSSDCDVDSLSDLSETARQELDALCPYDDLLGCRVDMIDAINDPRLSPHQRDLFLSALQPIPAAKRSKLSDDELIALLPSRYNSTLVDNAKYADYLRDLIDSEAVSVQAETTPTDTTPIDTTSGE